MKMKESEKSVQYVDITREVRKLWNMKKTVIPSATWTLRTVIEVFERGLEPLDISKRGNPY